MSTCKHTRTSDGQHYCFTASVAVHPYTHENRAAHGGITYTETCLDCGAERKWNANGNHTERSPWGPDRAARERQEREEIARLTNAQHRRYPMLRATNTYVAGRTPASDIEIIRNGETHFVSVSMVRRAATQEDIGDGLPQYYSEVLAAAGCERS